MTSDIKDDIIVLYIDLRQFLGACQLAFDGFIVQELDAVVILERLSGGSNISDGGPWDTLNEGTSTLDSST